MPRSPEQQFLRMALSGAVVALLIGGLLWLARGLVSMASTPAMGVAPAALPAQAAPAVQVAAAALLPTIAQRRPVSPASVVTTLPAQSMLALSATATASAGVITTAQSTADTALTTQLVQHLTCLVPQARHDVALDAQATELARRDDTPVPPAGVVQVESADALHLLLSTNVLADLRARDTRCGETLIFGIPPLEWLPNEARFGLGVATSPSGAIVVVVTR